MSGKIWFGALSVAACFLMCLAFVPSSYAVSSSTSAGAGLPSAPGPTGAGTSLTPAYSSTTTAGSGLPAETNTAEDPPPSTNGAPSAITSDPDSSADSPDSTYRLPPGIAKKGYIPGKGHHYGWYKNKSKGTGASGDASADGTDLTGAGGAVKMVHIHLRFKSDEFQGTQNFHLKWQPAYDSALEIPDGLPAELSAYLSNGLTVPENLAQLVTDAGLRPAGMSPMVRVQLIGGFVETPAETPGETGSGDGSGETATGDTGDTSGDTTGDTGGDTTGDTSDETPTGEPEMIMTKLPNYHFGWSPAYGGDLPEIPQVWVDALSASIMGGAVGDVTVASATQ